MNCRNLLISTVLLSISIQGVALGQSAVQWNVAGPANWTSSSWLSGAPPEASFDEFAVIDNAGIAFVQNTPLSPGGVILGDTGGGSGTLEIRSGGNLVVTKNTVNPPGIVNGGITVGNAGRGTLTILSGGSLTAESINSGGSSQSLIDLSGTASLTSHGIAVLNRQVRIVGQSVTFNVEGHLFLNAASTLIANVTSTNHSKINVTNGCGDPRYTSGRF